MSRKMRGTPEGTYHVLHRRRRTRTPMVTAWLNPLPKVSFWVKGFGAIH